MLDIVLIRERPEYVKEALRKVGDDPVLVDDVLALDTRRREVLTEVEELRAERNRVSKEIGKLKDQTEREERIVAMRKVGDRISELEEQLRAVEADLESATLRVPNVPHESVPLWP